MISRVVTAGTLVIMSLAFALSCFAEDMTNEEYSTLLKKGLAKANKFVSPFAGLSRGTDFTPIPGLDKPEAIPFLTDVLKNGFEKEKHEGQSRLTQCYAALCLGKIGDKNLVPVLVKAMKKKDEQDTSGSYVAVNCMIALVMIGSPEAKEPIIQLLQNGESASARYTAAWALGEMLDGTDNPDYEVLKKAATEDKSDQVRQAAQLAMEKIEKRIQEKSESVGGDKQGDN